MLCLVVSSIGCIDWGVGLLLLACWDSRFECRRKYLSLSLISVVCCQVEVSASG